jgi:alpha,alpha-trehalase
MVELLAQVRADESIWRKYLPQLQSEYDFWMRGAESVPDAGGASRRVVRVGDGYLNRYWDDSDKPRQESYAEDLEHAATSGRDEREYYRNIRAACESGWDFSTRWLDDTECLESIRTTTILPVDLNALMYRLETRLAACYEACDTGLAELFVDRAAYRKEQLQTLFFDEDAAFFADLDYPGLRPTGVLSLAAAFPLFLEIALPEQAQHVMTKLQGEFLAPGGWLTALRSSGQQWDRPNGWAPLQWVVFEGLCNYGYVADAELGGTRWANNNIETYNRSGKLFEKYDVEHTAAPATGGEYEVQDGFGWTNGVLLKLMNQLNIE